MLGSWLAFSHFPLYPQANWVFLVLASWGVGAGGVVLCTFYDPVSLSNKLSFEAGSFSCCLNPHRFFLLEALRLYFPALAPWVTRSVSLPSCSSCFIHTQMWDCQVLQPPVLPVWPFWLFFVFKFVFVLLVVVRGGTVCLPTPPSCWKSLLVFLCNYSLFS